MKRGGQENNPIADGTHLRELIIQLTLTCQMKMIPSEGLSFTGRYTVDAKEHEYKVTFNLINWKESSIENLIGEIPDYICRNINDMSVINDAICPDYIDSSNPADQTCSVNGVDISYSRCEYVSAVDGDHWIVLSKVEVDYNDPISNLMKNHMLLYPAFAALLLLLLFLQLKMEKRCSQSCQVGTVSHFAPDCRSGLSYSEDGEYTGKASQVISVRNIWTRYYLQVVYYEVRRKYK